MRQKYRIWDKQENKWFVPTFKAHKGHVEELLITPSGDFIMRTLNHQYENVLSHESLFPDRFETVWFTGLPDKNGKEIYEGDIAKQIEEDEVGIIEWENEPPGFLLICKNEKWLLSTKRIEVIGNIYESPELLQQPTG